MERNVVVVTGAASGMGMAAARRLSRADRVLFLADIDADRLDAARGSLTDFAAIETIQVATVDVSTKEPSTSSPPA